MSNPDFFADTDPMNSHDIPEPLDNDWQEDESNCPSCNFILSEHSAKQIVNCALKEIKLVRGVVR